MKTSVSRPCVDRSLLFLLFLVLLSSSQIWPQERISADSRRTTPGGVTFIAPAGWSIGTRASFLLLQPPEPDSHVAIMDIRGDVRAADAATAVAAAWAAYRPNAKRPLKTPYPSPHAMVGTN